MGIQNLMEARRRESLGVGMMVMTLNSLSTGPNYAARFDIFSSTEPICTKEERGTIEDRRTLIDQGSIVEKHRFIGGACVLIKWDQGSTYYPPLELAREWPEVAAIAFKLALGEKLTESEKQWLNELAEVTGWDVGDVIEDLRNLNADPSERVERYKQLFEQYYSEALKHKEAGNTRQAAEKLWGAVLALIKLYASIKGVAVIHWSRKKIEHFITSNVEKSFKSDFRNLIDKASALHEHFYEGYLDEESFSERWEETLEQLEKVKNIVYKSLAKVATNT